MHGTSENAVGFRERAVRLLQEQAHRVRQRASHILNFLALVSARVEESAQALADQT